jgi:protein CpxP
MKKLIIIAVTGILLAGSGFVIARDGHGGHGHKGQRGQHGGQFMPLTDRFMRAIRHLDLSEDQKESIHTTMQAMKAEINPVMGEMKAGHLQLKELIKADEFDEQAVAELAAKEGDLAAERILITSRAMSDVYAQLTDEQRTELEEMRAERMERRAERREQRSRDS